MRYCGQCGAVLDDTALAKGVCPACQTLISREGDVIVPLAVPELPLAHDSALTIPDDDAAAFAVPPPSGPGAPRWPNAKRAPTAARTVRGMHWPGVLALVLCVSLAAAGAGFLLRGHLHLRDKIRTFLDGTPTPRPTPTAPSSLRLPTMPIYLALTLPAHRPFAPE